MRPLRTEPCVCGGQVTARSVREAYLAVREHTMSLTHAVWRLGREAPTATFSLRDLSEMVRRASVPPVPCTQKAD